jgi:integrase
MPKVIDKLDLKRKGLYLFKQDNSPYWQLRLKIGKNKAEQCSTKLESKDEAIMFAIEKYGEYKEKIKNNPKSEVLTFKDVAQLVLDDLENDKNRSKKSLQNYASIISKFTEKFFKEIPVSDINSKKIDDYLAWRKNEYGDLKQSTVLKHNIALRQVLNKALDLEIPLRIRLEKIANDGEKGARRSAISYEDYHLISDKIIDNMSKSKNKEKQLAYSLLHDAIDFILCTGIRPGKELHLIRWKDIKVTIDDGVPKISVYLQKAKTKQRNSFVSIHFISVLHSLAKQNKNRKGDDYVFSLKDGKPMSDEFLGRKFSEILESLNIKTKGDNKFTLYSLRHSFITWHAFKETNYLSLAVQCGTSVDMIQKFYAHTSEKVQESNFSGVIDDDENIRNNFVTAKKLTDKQKDRITKYYTYMAENYKNRGFI